MMVLAASDSINIGNILMYLFGGLALFLFGMDQMSDALKLIAGSGMKKVLGRLTTNRFTGVFAGAFVTSVIQSSSITTVLAVGFISAGLMTLQQSIGVILGANIGTTITAQIIAFKITHYALVMVAIGFTMLFCFKQERIKHYGHMIMGLGLIFFGMQLMSDGTKPLRDYEPFINMMMQMKNPLLAILIAALFTGLVQSSSATTGIVIVLASQGFISLETGIALIFGANIGTCVTALLAAIGKPREAVRAAVVHVVFNVLGVLIWIFFIGQLAEWVRWISPSYAELTGTAKLGAETPRQIANAHTVFNVANTLIFVGFTGPLAWLVCKIVPDRPEKEIAISQPRHMDQLLLKSPALAMDTVRMELGRLGSSALRMVRRALPATIKGSEAELAELEEMDNEVDSLHGAIVTYLGRLSQESLNEYQSELLHDYLSAANYIENIGDLIETNLVDAGRERIKSNLVISPQTQQFLERLNDKVIWAVENSVVALVENDGEKAQQVLQAKSEINRLADATDEQLSRRLGVREPNRLVAFRLESEIIEYLKRIYYFSKRIAKLVASTDMDYLDKQTEETVDDDALAV